MVQFKPEYYAQFEPELVVQFYPDSVVYYNQILHSIGESRLYMRRFLKILLRNKVKFIFLLPFNN